ncbi:MAG: rRNA maturation RNase YbeY [Planctomycetota bacterium]|jgi:rRNA maturation RNase YbeY
MIRIQNQCEDFEPPVELLQKVLEATLGHRWEGTEVGEVAVDLVLMDDVGISAMNLEFKGREGPTDVLAWPDGTPDPDEGEFHLGDVAISVTTALKEAARRGIEPDHEVLLYALHGVLHLLGWRDGDDDERAAMRTAEREELARWEIAPHWEDPH